MITSPVRSDRSHATAPAQPTAPDLQVPAREPRPEPRKSQPDVWYLRYQDPSGRWCKAKATTEQVLKRLREGRFDAAVEGCHYHNGEFRPLGEFAEFRAVLAEAAKVKKAPVAAAQRPPTTEAVPSKPGKHPPALGWLPSWWMLAAVALGGVVLLVLAAVLLQWLLGL